MILMQSGNANYIVIRCGLFSGCNTIYIPGFAVIIAAAIVIVAVFVVVVPVVVVVVAVLIVAYPLLFAVRSRCNRYSDSKAYIWAAEFRLLGVVAARSHPLLV